MNHKNRFFNIFTLLALLVVSLGITAAPAAAQESPIVCIPTCSTTDGRMLSLASVGYSTLAGQTISLRLAVPATMPSFEIGIFDGDSSGTWDSGTTPLVYTLFADPTNTGQDTEQVTQWSGESMIDNDWVDTSVNQDSRAMAPSGDYFYNLQITLPNAGTVDTASNFKIRSNAPVELALNESFAYTAVLFPGNYNIIYPQYPTLTPTTFDGTWDLYFSIPASTSSFVIWDGDTDFGSFDCSVNDTNDSDTEDGVLPPWAIGISDMPEGVAASTSKCRDSAGNVITGPEGQITTTGYPADDTRTLRNLRSPSVSYDLIDPNGNVYHNANPSGNVEWEQFRIDSNPNTPADYHTGEVLPAGLYHLRVTGLDMNNLNAWHLTYNQTCVYEDGSPCIPLIHPYKVGDTVWNDINGNGTQDSDETGISGVAVTLVDSNGYPVPNGTTVTDANGNYSFGVEAGTYSMQIDAANFEAGGALAGYISTTPGGETQTNTVTTDNVLTYDFGYRGLASIGDRVWNDLNSNGIQDDGEAGVADVSILLLGSDRATVVGTTTTDALGNYSFTDIAVGTYTLQFVPPAGMSFVVADAGANDGLDSDADIITGKTVAVTLLAGQFVVTLDAGLKTNPVVNYCGYIRTPGFWKNYKNHMSDATFLNLIQHTQDFNYLTVKQAVKILSTNNGKTKLGIAALDGVNARYLKFLLTAEINAVWNGEDNAADLDGTLGIGVYQGTGLTVNQVLNQAYVDRRSYSSDQESYVVYLGADGEGVDQDTCLVQP